MKRVILLGAQGQASITIDGNVYQTLQTNLSGQLLIAQAASGTSITPGQTNVVAAGTRVQLPANAAKAVRLRAKQTNTGDIYFGDVTVAAATGDILAPGESVTLSIDNLNRIYIDAAVSGNGISWTVIN